MYVLPLFSTYVAHAESIDYIDMWLKRLCSDWLNSCSTLMYNKSDGDEIRGAQI